MTYPGPRPTTVPAAPDVDLTDAACRPWTGSHDSRNLYESDQQFQVRLSIAKAICATCPVAVDCLTLVKHYRAHRVPLDGIFVGHHFKYRGDAE